MKLLIAVLLAAVASCTMYAEDDNQLSVAPITPQASFWRFRNVNAYLMDKGVRIRGHLTASQLFGLPSGHVDVAAYSPDEELIVETTAIYTPWRLTRKTRRRGGVRFLADLAGVIPPGSTIKVAFHANNPGTRSKSQHGKTLAI